MKRFWDITENGTETEMRLDGEIAEESWWGDEVTPAIFRSELMSHQGDLTVWINSPGGDVFAASEIYTALKEYKGRVTVKIEGIAASAASVIAMAGDQVLMSPTAYLMIHNPWTVAGGDADTMKQAAKVLEEIKEGILNAYELKTGMSRNRISALMDKETWMSAKSALELGFADGMLYAPGEEPEDILTPESVNAKAMAAARARHRASAQRSGQKAVVYAAATVSRALVEKVLAADRNGGTDPQPENPEDEAAREAFLNRMTLMNKCID